MSTKTHTYLNKLAAFKKLFTVCLNLGLLAFFSILRFCWFWLLQIKELQNLQTMCHYTEYFQVIPREFYSYAQICCRIYFNRHFWSVSYPWVAFQIYATLVFAFQLVPCPVNICSVEGILVSKTIYPASDDLELKSRACT